MNDGLYGVSGAKYESGAQMAAIMAYPPLQHSAKRRRQALLTMALILALKQHNREAAQKKYSK